MTGCLYNEIDAYASQWLGRLISAGHIAPGDVDGRSIVDIRPADLAARSQVHLFAGIGVWSHALRRAGWPDDRPVWTASFPCQPFSAAGKRKGAADERHLWPVGFELIRAFLPPVIFGEQVASPDGLGWWDTVSADLEGEGYSCRAFDLCAAGVGAPHIRQRLYWVACAAGAGQLGRRSGQAGEGGDTARIEPERLRDAGWLADTERERVRARGPGGIGSPPGSMQGVDGERERLRADALTSYDAMGTRPGPTNGLWRDADWLGCRDGRWRPVEPGTQPLVDGVAGRVGRLRAYGNAIVAPLAQAFIEEVMACLDAQEPNG